MLLFRQQDSGQSSSIKIINTFSKNVVQLKYLGTIVTNLNFSREVIKRRLNLGSACYD
jgi:hypothetical protein